MCVDLEMAFDRVRRGNLRNELETSAQREGSREP